MSRLDRMCDELGGYGDENKAQFLAGDFSCAPDEDKNLLEMAIEFDRMEDSWRQRVAKLEDELAELRPLDNKNVSRACSRDSEPIHLWFNLTYANYLVLARSHLQSMPHWWQERFVACLEELCYAFDDAPSPSYRVNAVDSDTKRFIKDPIPHYNRGRTFVPNRLQPEHPMSHMIHPIR
jgi:hypothetical protein